MGVFLRVFDPKGYRYNYTDSNWRDVGRNKIEPVNRQYSNQIRDDLDAEDTGQLAAETQARARPPEPGDETWMEEEPLDPQDTTLRRATTQTPLEKQYTDKREFYGPGDLTGIASDFMKKNIHTVKEGSLVSEAAELFKRQSITHLPVITEKHLICGLITEHQLYRSLIDGSMTRKKLDKEKVNTVMRSPVLCCLQGTPIEALLETFVKENVSVLPVVDKNDQLKGIVDKRDLLKYFYESSHFFGRSTS